MKKIIYTLMAVVLMAGASTSCSLDQYPHTSSTSQDVFSSVEGYQSALGGIYAAFVQRIGSVSDESRRQNYIRTLFQFQDASTDACDPVWLAGEGLTDINGLCWTASDPWCSAMYYHIYNIVAMCNDFISNAVNPEFLSGFSDSEIAVINGYCCEARFLRAYAYSHAIDFYSSMPFVDENTAIGSNVTPELKTRAEIFDYVVSELKEIAPQMAVSNYGHANRGAAYALLSRLYLNSGVYLGVADADNVENWNNCIDASRQVLKDYTELEKDYYKLFNGDNHKRTNEIIFAFACDADNTSTWDATTYLTCGCVLANFADYVKVWGTEASGAWDNLRARPELVNAFSQGDTRALFLDYDRSAVKDADGNVTGYTTTTRSKDISAHDDATTGYRIYKWTNLTDEGEAASNCGTNGADTDFPVFRLAEVYLNMAEAVARGATEYPSAEALARVNDVRTRAFGTTTTDGSLDLDFLCKERLRELYMECLRRTDLIRFGKYTSGYDWQWKANVEDGADVDSKYRFLAIPEAEYSVNPQLQTVNNSLGF